MNIDEAFSQAEAIKSLEAKGIQCVASLRAFITEEFSQHLKILGKSNHLCLYLSFHGQDLSFRVQYIWGDKTLKASICAYRVTEGSKEEIPLGVDYQFDRLGNVSGRMTVTEFPGSFIEEVFNSLAQQKAILKP